MIANTINVIVARYGITGRFVLKSVAKTATWVDETMPSKGKTYTTTDYAVTGIDGAYIELGWKSGKEYPIDSRIIYIHSTLIAPEEKDKIYDNSNTTTYEIVRIKKYTDQFYKLWVMK